ncbi:fasciclin domain-containing protein [Streptomyces sp. NPDC102264]|uniref:fasciclin domain-containing protein n=1 Tax=Streptomyces sp. NPDC102264 TaxID=3366149 RepID=UPI00382EFA67
MKSSRIRRTVVSAAAVVALPVSLGVMAPQAFADPAAPGTPTPPSAPVTPSTPTSPGESTSPGGSTSPSASASPSESTSPSTSTSPSPSTSPSRTAVPNPAVPFGPGCSSIPKTGTGSLAQMATEKVATAISHNPDFTTFLSLVKKAGLTDRLNTAKDITLFVPTNEAFKKLSTAQLDQIKNNEAQLRKVVKYHVAEKKVTPDLLPNGVFSTWEGTTLSTSGSDRTFKVNDTAKILCGNIKTENATVYTIDTVLTPK